MREKKPLDACQQDQVKWYLIPFWHIHINFAYMWF